MRAPIDKENKRKKKKKRRKTKTRPITPNTPHITTLVQTTLSMHFGEENAESTYRRLPS